MNQRQGRKECLRFQPFVPTASPKDMRGLVETVRGLASYQSEAKGARCTFLRGSTVSSYDPQYGMSKAHSGSDLDIIVVTRRREFTRGCTETFLVNGQPTIMPVDITNVDQVRLDRESETLGARGVGSLFHFAHDSVVLTETQRYDHYRRMALLAFLRIGLSYYGRPAEVTPSGAMKAINQGKLLVNPLRWWSIGYSFLHSPTAEQNKAAYYQAVEGALWHKFEKRGTVDGEYIYRIPEDFDIEAHVTRLRAIFLLNVLMRKVHSKPIGTINDVRKIMMKIKSLLRIVLEGQLDIDKLFEVSEESRIGEQEAG